jgi:hypothetical protein
VREAGERSLHTTPACADLKDRVVRRCSNRDLLGGKSLLFV